MIFINKISQIKYKINIDIIELFHIINIKKKFYLLPLIYKENYLQFSTLFNINKNFHYKIIKIYNIRDLSNIK